MTRPRVNLMQGDCLELMEQIPDGSVDLVLTDPPYQLNNWTNPYQWDKALDLPRVWDTLNRVCRYGAARCLFGNEPYSTVQRNSNPAQFKYDLVWVKNRVTAPMLAKVRPLKRYELISVFSDGKTSPGRAGNMSYYPQGLVRIDKSVKNSRKNRSVIQDRPSLKESYVQEYTGYPDDVLMFDCEAKTVHPTQKPVALMEYLIRTYTKEGETVLDFTMGSGTTGVAAINTGRRFIGVERDKNYFKIAEARIAAAKAQE